MLTLLTIFSLLIKLYLRLILKDFTKQSGHGIKFEKDTWTEFLRLPKEHCKSSWVWNKNMPSTPNSQCISPSFSKRQALIDEPMEIHKLIFVLNAAIFLIGRKYAIPGHRIWMSMPLRWICLGNNFVLKIQDLGAELKTTKYAYRQRGNWPIFIR